MYSDIQHLKILVDRPREDQLATTVLKLVFNIEVVGARAEQDVDVRVVEHAYEPLGVSLRR
jgi:hypothetical protein